MDPKQSFQTGTMTRADIAKHLSAAWSAITSSPMAVSPTHPALTDGFCAKYATRAGTCVGLTEESHELAEEALKELGFIQAKNLPDYLDVDVNVVIRFATTADAHRELTMDGLIQRAKMYAGQHTEITVRRIMENQSFRGVKFVDIMSVKSEAKGVDG